MSIPKNITREHLLSAITEIDQNGVPREAESTKYDIIFEGNKYPPKLVISIANRYANGTELPRESFSGGSASNDLLKQFDFRIGEKTSASNRRTMDFFTNEEFDLLEETAEKPYDKSFPDMTKAYQDLKVTYGKVKYWAEELQKKMFPDGKVKITQRPTNQANKFDGYLWAKIYPTQEDLKDKWLALTVGIDSSQNYVVKIDTVGLTDDTTTRRKYFAARGDYNNSEIVLQHQQLKFSNWESLLKQSEKDLEDLMLHYPNIKALRKSIEFSKDEVIKTSHGMKTNAPLNQILYGPPGTGKTYATKHIALKIANPDFKYDTEGGHSHRKQLNQAYNELVGSGQIIFTTFHQSFAYEDFVEGIKPFVEDEIVKYEVKKGVFKELCTKAEKTSLVSNFDEIYQRYIEDINEESDFTLHTPKHKKPFNVFVSSNQNSIAVPKTPKATRMSITKDMIRDYIDGGKIGEWQSYIIAIGDYIKTKYGSDIVANRNVKRNYVLIIDEINRGNVSSIFGELITLLEPDKRKGRKEAIELQLPYSKEPFSVPPNVFIIGTMNTADRSVEAIDTALRRRFSFTEVMPNPSLLSPSYAYWDLLWKYRDKEWENDEYKAKEKSLFEFIGADDDLVSSRKEIWERMKKEGLNLDQTSLFEGFQYHGIRLDIILKNINRRIEALLDRDHTIGHSYFMQVYDAMNKREKLEEVFKDKIIPLLQEYFFGDYSKIGLVLGEAFVGVEDSPANKIFASSDKFEAVDIRVKYLLKSFDEIDFDAAMQSLMDYEED